MGTYILEALSLICTPLNIVCLFAATFLGLIVGIVFIAGVLYFQNRNKDE